MEYLQESGASIHRRRRRQRAAVTLTVVTLLLIGTFVYAAAFVQGMIGTPVPRPLASATCNGASAKVVTPRMVTINVYNATSRDGLAASVAESLQRLGFPVAKVGNDPLSLTIQGVGEIRHGPAGQAGAFLAATRLSGAKLAPDERTDDTVDIVLGDKFKALSAPRKGARLKAVKTSSC